MASKVNNPASHERDDFSAEQRFSSGGAEEKTPPHEERESFATQSRWLPVKKMAILYQDVISEQSLRALIWQAEAYAKKPKLGLKSNGFLPVIVRPPNQRKVLLDRVAFEVWLTSRQQKHASA